MDDKIEEKNQLKVFLKDFIEMWEKTLKSHKINTVDLW